MLTSDVSDDELVDVDIRPPPATVPFREWSARAMTSTKDGNVIDLSAGILEHCRVSTIQNSFLAQDDMSREVPDIEAFWC